MNNLANSFVEQYSVSATKRARTSGSIQIVGGRSAGCCKAELGCIAGTRVEQVTSVDEHGTMGSPRSWTLVELERWACMTGTVQEIT